MNAARLRRPAVLAGGLALAAMTAGAPFAAAGEGEPAGPHNEQVALVDGSDKQPLEQKSDTNGTANVASLEGAHIVFSTRAKLVPEDTNRTYDVYLRDRVAGATVLVSAKDGVPGDAASFEPTISDDGRHVAFTTRSTNLAKRSGSKVLDVVVKDLQTGSVRLVSRSTEGKPGDRNSFFPTISADGAHVSFQTFASFGPKDQDAREDVYVRNLAAGTTRQASLLVQGGNVRASVVNGDISDDGRWVAYGHSEKLWVRDMVENRTIMFHHEFPTAECQPVEGLASAGRPMLSGDGRFAVFSSCSQDLVGGDATAEIFRIDLESGEIIRVTHGNADSYLPSISRTGRYLGFASDASNLVEGDDEGMADAFRVDLETMEVVRVSESPEGEGGNNQSATHAAALSNDGSTLVYPTYADNLVPGDVSNYEEVLAWVS